MYEEEEEVAKVGNVYKSIRVLASLDKNQRKMC
jgi:hypothetical protein